MATLVLILQTLHLTSPYLGKVSQANAIQAAFKALSAVEAGTKELWKLQEPAMRMARGGLHPCLVGPIVDVADDIRKWIEADVDGERRLYWKDDEVPANTFGLNSARLQTRVGHEVLKPTSQSSVELRAAGDK
ncbi:hypothetical protein F5Y18DRAFT_421727 [Xylariaceae sp. FL1019]|nr:hypothetical protein F5Y18DRAFT_421727 [Xylariaceae sp. FL1019]